MATKQELEQKLKDLQESLDAVPAEFKADIQKEIEKTQSDIAVMSGAPTEAPAMPAPAGTNFADVALASLKALMESQPSTGMDSASVRSAIEQYFSSKKINLSELDKDVIEEIKKSQKVVIELPNFGNLKIEVSRAEQQIPYFFEILDDVLAGNNVYLIGGAGLGKTYTAEQVSKKLEREYLTINCSQYTSPIEIIGGQTIQGYRDGKLITAWRDGKLLILDEMPRLDPNTAGLFNDALAKSSKTNTNPYINSANPAQPPIKKNNDFAVIATGNVYPNEAPPPQYKANNQQDLSLLDRFSGSVYKVMPSKLLDEEFCRFQFIYDMLIGNYYEYMEAVANKTALPEPKGLRTVLRSFNLDELAVVSYRTVIAFRVAFEFQLVRAIAESEGKEVLKRGKTLQLAFDSYMVAFNNEDSRNKILNATKLTPAFIQAQVSSTIKKVLAGDIKETLTPSIQENFSGILKRYQDLFVAETYQLNA
jgi:hypothetical protein